MSEDFRQFVRRAVDRHYYISPSAVTLLSFYVLKIEKPKEVTVKMFEWLRAIAEKEIKKYKQNKFGNSINSPYIYHP